MRMLARLVGCLVLCVSAGTAAAQVKDVDFTGTYRLEGPEGTLTIVLRQTAKHVTGKMFDESGTTMLIEAEVSGGELAGLASIGDQKFRVSGTLREPDRLAWSLQVAENFGQEYLLQRVRAAEAGPGAAAPAQNPLASRTPNPLAAQSPFVGDFRKADGSVSVTLRQQGDGFSGTLRIAVAGAVNEFPMALRLQEGALAGTFGEAPQAFPVTLHFAPGSDDRQLVVTSGDYVHVLDRRGGEKAAFRHPQGWYTLALPEGWRALAQKDPMAVVLDAGKPGAFISVLASQVDPDEDNQSVQGLLQNGLTEIDAILQGDFGIKADSAGTRATALSAAQLPAAEATWSGTIQAGGEAQPVRIWTGAAAQENFVVLILAVLNPEQAAQLMPQCQGVLASLRILKAPSQAELEKLADAPEQGPDPFAGLSDTPEFNHHVTVNGTRLDDATIGVLERGMGIEVPDNDYWYDPVCGAVGGMGGPAVAFFPPRLRLGGPLPANASGGGNGMLTGVFVNGRELHPQDVIGLASITGPIDAGRYWLDGSGNFGFEGGGVAGNLLLLARARQAQGGGGGGAGGGSEAWTRYKDYGGVADATNFGSFGGGDFYFSSGGNSWWPGK